MPLRGLMMSIQQQLYVITNLANSYKAQIERLEAEIKELKTIRGNSVLVPNEKLQEMQSEIAELRKIVESAIGQAFYEDDYHKAKAEIEALKKQIPDWENINKPNPFIGWEKTLVSVDSNPNSGLGGIALKKASEK
jgi:uncharacterized coiled-coil DUF342 family protein